MRYKTLYISLIAVLFCSYRPVPTYTLARLKYNGGGDWYGDRTALPNLVKFCNQQLKTNFKPDDETVEVGSSQIFNYPFIFMTGHGNVIFSDLEARNLRKYLIGGGFLHICDNYGMDKFIRPQMKKVFPELELVELPLNHPIYHQKFDFANGLPKIHEHDNKRPQGFGLIYKGRLVCFYDVECDLGNGWEDAGTYAGDSPERRLKALKMGANMVQYALMR
ncbi:DUF4159 domain-containing protein [Mucilaginibacter daejeonensis]|uniref:DUF4159 domain-containing protein n=1 Tax=Mucilaginibacter daejeonensis TaxID=398049 RepID=UPI001D175D27|nr:DUF4159 domain-containing protein [Mucilaginibacter daejeonensis]UEG52893.1 DUF4159 domain-containing protein [Mucilaginibacter daejeonensis]